MRNVIMIGCDLHDKTMLLKIARSQHQASRKTDEKDAQQLLELPRAHVLAGNPLPTVWIPDETTRDDRELVRTRLDVAEKVTRVKSRINKRIDREPTFSTNPQTP